MTTKDEYNSGAATEGGVELRQLYHAVRKRKWLVIASVAICIGIAVAYTSRLPKRYRATASVVIDPRPPEILGGEVKEVVQMGTGSFWTNQEYYNTQVQILESRELAKLTVRKFSLIENSTFMAKIPAELSEEDRIARAAKRLVGFLEITPPKNNRIVRISVETDNPDLAALLANAHVETYIQYTKDLRTSGTALASDWLSGELDAAELSLRKSETKLFQFKRDNDILSVSLEDRQNLVANNIARFTDALASTRAKRIEVGALRERIHEARKQDLLSSPVFALANSGTGEALKTEVYSDQKKLIELEKNFGRKYPDVIGQRKKVEEAKAALEREANLAVAAVDDRYTAIITTEKGLAAQVERHKTEAFELGPKEVDYNRLARQVKHNEGKYNVVLSRLGASDLASRLTTVNIRLMDKALKPTSPAFPSLPRNAAAAMFFGLVLGLGLALLLEMMDRTIKSAEDVEPAVGAPVLGVVPAVSFENDEDRDLLVFRDPKSRVAECCRSIRTNLLFMSADRVFKTLVVTSPNPREGKTTSVLYLGTTMAQSGQRVVVIDTDMRRPRLHQSLGVGRSTGLSNVILGERELDDVIKATEVPNLYVLPCGPTPPNPAELLMTDRFNQVLKELEGKFDRVLLDSPPILAVTDAAVLSKRCDGVLLVMKAGSTLREQATRAAKILRDVEARLVGVVLNQLDVDNKSYGYYHHHYAYGYGPKEDTGAEAA